MTNPQPNPVAHGVCLLTVATIIIRLVYGLGLLQLAANICHSPVEIYDALVNAIDAPGEIL